MSTKLGTQQTNAGDMQTKDRINIFNTDWRKTNLPGYTLSLTVHYWKLIRQTIQLASCSPVEWLTQ